MQTQGVCRGCVCCAVCLSEPEVACSACMCEGVASHMLFLWVWPTHPEGVAYTFSPVIIQVPTIL